MECAGCAVIWSVRRWCRDIILSGEASDDLGIESSSIIVCRRGAHSRKSRSRVMESFPGSQDLRSRNVRFAMFLQGRHVMTPPRVNMRKDERSLSKSALSRIAGQGQVRSMCNPSRRGARQ